MEFDLYIYSEHEVDTILKNLKQIFNLIMKNDLKIENNDDRDVLLCNLFTVDLLKDIDVEYIDFICTEYEVNVNYRFYIEIFTKTYSLGIIKICEVIKQIIEGNKGDVLFIENGSIEIIKKNKNGIFLKNTNNPYEFAYNELDMYFN